MSPLKIGIVEDDMLVAESIIEMLQDCGYMTTSPALRYSEAIAMLEQEAPDLLLIDVHILGKMDGIDVARTVQQSFELPFIFLTANTDVDTIRRARDLKPASFLAKPVTRAQLFASIEMAITAPRAPSQAAEPAQALMRPPIFVKDGFAFRKIREDDIMFIESEQNYVIIHLEGARKLTIRGTLTEFAERLDGERFMRIHRGVLAAVSRIEKITGDTAIVSGREVPVSRRNREELLRVLRIRD